MVHLKRFEQVTHGETGSTRDKGKSLFNGFASQVKSSSTAVVFCKNAVYAQML